MQPLEKSPVDRRRRSRLQPMITSNLVRADETTEEGQDQQTPHDRGILCRKNVVEAKSKQWNAAPITVAVSADRASRRPASENRDARNQHREGKSTTADAVPGE